jgi:hypothetical protein
VQLVDRGPQREDAARPVDDQRALHLAGAGVDEHRAVLGRAEVVVEQHPRRGAGLGRRPDGDELAAGACGLRGAHLVGERELLGGRRHPELVGVQPVLQLRGEDVEHPGGDRHQDERPDEQAGVEVQAQHDTAPARRSPDRRAGGWAAGFRERGHAGSPVFGSLRIGPAGHGTCARRRYVRGGVPGERGR